MMMMMMIMVCQGHDRLLLIAGADINHRGRSRRRAPSGDGSSGGGSSTADLTMTHVQLPHLYITSNWPLQHVALSESGADIAVAGRRGLALYNRPTEKWVHARCPNCTSVRQQTPSSLSTPNFTNPGNTA